LQHHVSLAELGQLLTGPEPNNFRLLGVEFEFERLTITIVIVIIINGC